MLQKESRYRNKKILAAAKGEPCFANFPGCTGGGEDTAARHLNESWAGKGGSQKADDVAIFFGCQHCENLYAGLIAHPNWDAEKDSWMVHRANYRTVRRLLDKGVLK